MVFYKWFCVNSESLINSCKIIETRFNQCVVSIHNKTFGILLDLIESGLNRQLNIRTYAVQNTADHIKKRLLKNDVNKVVLIGHS